MLAKSHCIMNVSTPDYTSLFAKFKEGDDHAFSFFYEFYINDLYAYGISLGGEKEVVKDAVQDIFLKIYFEKKDFSSVDHLKYFLLKSLKNRLYNVHKSKAVSTTTGISSDVHGFSDTVQPYVNHHLAAHGKYKALEASHTYPGDNLVAVADNEIPSSSSDEKVQRWTSSIWFIRDARLLLTKSGY